jgi:hypothetical protein
MEIQHGTPALHAELTDRFDRLLRRRHARRVRRLSGRRAR